MPLEPVDLFGAEILGEPLPLVFGEEGEGFGPDGLGIQGGVFHSAAGADVGSEIFHGGDLLWVKDKGALAEVRQRAGWFRI